MTLGEKLRQARYEAGLTQQGLCGEQITRNMLSQIETGAAQPSVGTLRYLAERLGKPVSFFLEEETAVSPNTGCMEAAWQAFLAGKFSQCEEQLKDYRAPDVLYDREYTLLRSLNLISLAQQAGSEGRTVLAVTLLDTVQELEKKLPWLPELSQRRQLLLWSLPGKHSDLPLPNVDAQLLILGAQSLEAGSYADAARFLDAVREPSPHWNLLRGNAARLLGDYPTAIRCLTAAEPEFPAETAPALEECYRETGDFRMAYLYACRQRNQ